MIKDISFEILQKCPNNCIHCSSCSTNKSTHFTDFETIYKVAQDMPKLGVERVCLSGGEPFLHKDLEKIVSFISSLNIDVNIYSSGITEEDGKVTFIDKKRLENLKNLGLKKVMFSLQSFKEKNYDKIMGTTNRFELTKKSIKNAVEAGLYTEIHFVPMKINLEDIDGVIELSKKLGVNKVSFLELVPHGRALLNKDEILLSKDEKIYLREKLKSIKSEIIRIGAPLSLDFDEGYCKAASSKLYIKFDGEVFGCEAFKYIKDLDEKDSKPLNIFQTSLIDIYENSEYLKKTKEFIKKYSCLDSKCESCPVQKYLESLKKD